MSKGKARKIKLLDIHCEFATVGNDMGSHVVCCCYSTVPYGTSCVLHLLTSIMKMFVSSSCWAGHMPTWQRAPITMVSL